MKATLENGNVHYLGNKRFDRGVPVEITADEKTKLEKSVVKALVANKEVEICKFVFDEEEEAPKPKASTGSRRKKADEASE